MIAIKDMEMPNNCSECGLKSGSYCYFKKPPYNFNGINILNERASGCPLVEIEERKQSEWYLRGGKFTCKNCEERALLKLTDATGGCREYSYYTSKFCPNCGAGMRGSENDL